MYDEICYRSAETPTNEAGFPQQSNGRTNIISSDAYREFWGLKHCIFMDIHFKGKI